MRHNYSPLPHLPNEHPREFRSTYATQQINQNPEVNEKQRNNNRIPDFNNELILKSSERLAREVEATSQNSDDELSGDSEVDYPNESENMRLYKKPPYVNIEEEQVDDYGDVMKLSSPNPHR